MRRWIIVSDVIIIDSRFKNFQVERNSAIYLSLKVVSVVGVTLVGERHLTHPLMGKLELGDIWNRTVTCICTIFSVKPTFARERKLDFSFLACTLFLLGVMTIGFTIRSTLQGFT